MIKNNYKNFLLEKIVDKTLNYYMFDWDDNILVMPTMIHVEKLVNGEWIPTDVSTAKFSEIRKEISDYIEGRESIWRLRNNSYVDTYCEFRDYGPRGEIAFIEDTVKSIKTNSFGPVWDKFIECLTNGKIFMIITARGHEPQTIRSAVEWIIYRYLNSNQKEQMEINLRKFNKLFDVKDFKWTFKDLVNNYLEMCDFIGIYSKYFQNKFNLQGETMAPEKYKAIAVRYFTDKVNKFGKEINRRIKVGFSDDDIHTAQHVYKYMRDELWYDYPIDYYVYHTKDGIKKL